MEVHTWITKVDHSSGAAPDHAPTRHAHQVLRAEQSRARRRRREREKISRVGRNLSRNSSVGYQWNRNLDLLE